MRFAMSTNLPFSSCPFREEHSLLKKPTSSNRSLSNSGSFVSETKCVPGQPALDVDDVSTLVAFLEQDLLTLNLDKMSPYLWMMSTPSSSHIKPLHRQLVKGRKIVITEEPRLHLLWLQDRIFIKPIPLYLLSHHFWTDTLLSNSPELRKEQRLLARASFRFIRTYLHLIRHESDLRIAQQGDTPLLPKNISWEDICRFLSDLKVISDMDVTPRYHFGELRLSRLNFYSKFVLGKFHYERLHVQYGSYFSQFYGPLLLCLAYFR